MVDLKDTNERAVETGAGLGQAGLKVWVKPRLESLDIAEDTAGPTPTHSTNDGVATSMS